MSKTKVSTFVGTRPEIIRLSCIIKKFDQHFNHRLIHTGQNPDPLLRDVFFNEMDIRQPDKYFPDTHKTLGEFLANLMISTEKELIENRPDAIVILGDTNSSLAAIIAKRFGIPIYHLEAGNRSFDSNVPEEINRRIIDHIADFNFPYSELSRANLLAEGIHPRKISLMGSPLLEVINTFKSKIYSSNILEDLKIDEYGYFLVSAHRQENVDSELRLRTLLATLEKLAEKFQIPVLVSTHPRTRARLAKLSPTSNKLIIFHEPFGFIDYAKLQTKARIVLSDSGTISEESIILGFKAITIRDSMERPEALESGCIIMSGIQSDQVIEAIRITEASEPAFTTPPEYQIPDVSTRIVNVIVSTVHQHEFWNGLRPI